jgi:hypothetical protein
MDRTSLSRTPVPDPDGGRHWSGQTVFAYLTPYVGKHRRADLLIDLRDTVGGFGSSGPYGGGHVGGLVA